MNNRPRNHPAKRLLMLLCVFLLISPLARAQLVNVRFYSGKNILWSVDYADSLFVQPGKIYRQDLATASLGMALSAFRTRDVPLDRRGENIQKYMQEAGFSHLSLQQFDVEPTIRTIASAIGQKTIQVGQTQQTLLAVAVSGGGYRDEWKSNFSIGNSIHHEGFDRAAKQVQSHLTQYIKQQGIKGDIKIWVSGYSRAAATSNRLGALILESQLVPANNLYVYTFATPNVTKQTNAGTYPSIFNVVGAFDPVPMIPFSDWGFTRYGQTFYLPSPEISSDYEERVRPVRDMFRRMTGSEFWTNQSSKNMVQKAL